MHDSAGPSQALPDPAHRSRSPMRNAVPHFAPLIPMQDASPQASQPNLRSTPAPRDSADRPHCQYGHPDDALQADCHSCEAVAAYLATCLLQCPGLLPADSQQAPQHPMQQPSQAVDPGPSLAAALQQPSGSPFRMVMPAESAPDVYEPSAASAAGPPSQPVVAEDVTLSGGQCHQRDIMPMAS